MSKEVLTSQKDYVGRDVQIGDTVAYVQVGYSNLKVDKVAKITPKGVTLRNGTNRTRNQFVKV